MAKTITVFCVLTVLISVLSFGQNVSMEETLLSQAGLSGAGITRLNEKTYYRMQLQPSVNLGKVGLGLDLVLLYNPDDGLRAEDGEEWGSFSDYLRAIRYVRYGHKSPTEPIYVLYGALDYTIIGHGTIMGGYSNYDRRGLRLDLNFSNGMFGVETVLNNFANPTIFGGRVHVRPLQKKGIPIIGRFTLGTTYITDIDPVYATMIDEKGEEIKQELDKKVVSLQDLDPLVAFGIDLGLPIFENPAIKMQLYDDLVLLKYQNKIGEDKTGKGNAAGIGMQLMGGVHFKIEYRQFGSGFRPTIFNYTYEHEKTLICNAEDDQQPNGEDDEAPRCGLKFNDDPLKGIYSQLTYSLMNKIFLNGAYENYDNRNPNLYVQLTESGLVEKVSFSALYTKNQIEGFSDIFDLDEKSLLTMRIGYEIFKLLDNPFEIAIIREWRFRETDDEKGFETIKKTSVEFGVNMQF